MYKACSLEKISAAIKNGEIVGGGGGGGGRSMYGEAKSIANSLFFIMP